MIFENYVQAENPQEATRQSRAVGTTRIMQVTEVTANPAADGIYQVHERWSRPDLQLRRCEEASIHSKEKYIPCSAPSTSLVWSPGDRRAYSMCAACAAHSVKNRRGLLIFQLPEEASP